MWNLYTIVLCVVVGILLFGFGFHIGWVLRDAVEEAILRRQHSRLREKVSERIEQGGRRT